jgi:MiaB/RimO family radical SAM methylthiotransferase
MQQFLIRNGWRAADSIEGADLIIFNACGLTAYSEECSVNIAKSIQKRKAPGSRMIVCGCLPKINPRRLEGIYDGPTFGSDDPHALSGLVGLPLNGNPTAANYLIPYTDSSAGWKSRLHHLPQIMNPYSLLSLPHQKTYSRFAAQKNITGPNVFYIKAATGCLNQCTYCAVKLSRGALSSKPVDRIVGELRSGLEAGFRDFALIGSDLGCYGRDLGTDLVQMLRALVREPGNFKLRIRNVHPRFMIEMLPGLAEVFAAGKITFMISAAQSGSNRVLERMGRGYRIEDFIATVESLKKAAPGIQLRTQIMAGFPGETEGEFEDTLRLLDRVAFDFVEVYGYSPRPGTPAAGLRGRLPQRTIIRRVYHLQKRVLRQLKGKAVQAA